MHVMRLRRVKRTHHFSYLEEKLMTIEYDKEVDALYITNTGKKRYRIQEN